MFYGSLKGYTTSLVLFGNGQCQEEMENVYCGRKIIQIIHLYGKLMSKQKHSSGNHNADVCWFYFGIDASFYTLHLVRLPK